MTIINVALIAAFICMVSSGQEAVYKSQAGQDELVSKLFFRNKNDGFYLDIGAHDGESFSNTYYFDRLGWRGIAIEPLPHLFAKLQACRTCICVNACISAEEGMVPFCIWIPVMRC